MDSIRNASISLAEAKSMKLEGWTEQQKTFNEQLKEKMLKKAETDPIETLILTAMNDANKYMYNFKHSYNYRPDTGLEAAVMQNRQTTDKYIVVKALALLGLLSDYNGLPNETRTKLIIFLREFN
jgi:hypothetical protein